MHLWRSKDLFEWGLELFLKTLILAFATFHLSTASEDESFEKKHKASLELRRTELDNRYFFVTIEEKLQKNTWLFYIMPKGYALFWPNSGKCPTGFLVISVLEVLARNILSNPLWKTGVFSSVMQPGIFAPKSNLIWVYTWQRLFAMRIQEFLVADYLG